MYFVVWIVFYALLFHVRRTTACSNELKSNEENVIS